MSKVHTLAVGLVLALGIPLVVTWLFIRVTPRTPKLPVPPLKDLAAQHGLQLGNFAIPKRLNEQPYRDILTSQFNFALIDNQPNWHFTDADLRPTPTTYNFSRIDEVMQFASNHHLPVEMHHFVWGEEKWLPTWLKSGDYAPQQLLEIMRDHIMTVGQHYSGRVQTWSVVNEAFSRAQHIYGLRDWWADHIGDQGYIDQAFRWARQADPHATLMLNDFQNEAKNDISDAMYDYVKGALGRGVPIDAIGLQMHIDGSHPPVKDEVIENMRRFGQLGLKVNVTEFDVNMNDVRASTKAKDQLEATVYYEMMRACIESKVCHSFAILGITDKESWYNYLGLANARPLPFDQYYQPKPAFFSLRAALAQS